jgi:sulfite exporter TauE/SafE
MVASLFRFGFGTIVIILREGQFSGWLYVRVRKPCVKRVRWLYLC